jgi:uncharacterized protein YegL
MNDRFIRSLPLVASALGRKYGLKIIIGGTEAATNGDTIFLPALPLDSPPEMVALARGFLDHESAHIRDTNMEQLKKAHLNPLEHHLWNIIEDWRVEKVLGDHYPGCRQNFQWLIRHMFLQPLAGGDSPPDLDLLNWLLLTVRSWAVPELAERLDDLRVKITAVMPRVLNELEPILAEIKAHCPDTKAAIAYARRITKFFHDQANPPAAPVNSIMLEVAGDDGSDANQQLQTANAGSNASMDSQGNAGEHDQTASILDSLLSRPASELPSSIGEMVGNLLSEASRNVQYRGAGLEVAQVAHETFPELSAYDLAQTRAATLALKCRLTSLLQSLTLKKVQAAYQGTLDTNRLHRLFAADPKVFRRSGTRVGLDTAIHLLLDASGSMRGDPIHLVSLAAYALCEALSAVPGISVGATVFPGGGLPSSRKKRRSHPWNSETVAPILGHGQQMHRKFLLSSGGGTPLGEALWWVMQKLSARREKRKIILILTDGEPNLLANAQVAIQEAHRQGFELYGLGLRNESIKRLLPGSSLVIENLRELPKTLFQLLGRAMSLETDGGHNGKA